jgi:galactose-1-phosphate uridylyltransferase
MKHRLVILLAPLVFFQCTYYHKAFKKESSYFSDTERRMLAETTAAVTFSYGFDADIEFDYVLTYPYTRQNFPAKEKALQQLIASYDAETFTAFYEKMYYLKALHEESRDHYNAKKNGSTRPISTPISFHP